jgi:hypothetical protein
VPGVEHRSSKFVDGGGIEGVENLRTVDGEAGNRTVAIE